MPPHFPFTIYLSLSWAPCIINALLMSRVLRGCVSVDPVSLPCLITCTLKAILSWPEETITTILITENSLAYLCLHKENDIFLIKHAFCVTLFCVDSHEQVWQNCSLHPLQRWYKLGSNLPVHIRLFKIFATFYPVILLLEISQKDISTNAIKHLWILIINFTTICTSLSPCKQETS